MRCNASWPGPRNGDAPCFRPWIPALAAAVLAVGVGGDSGRAATVVLANRAGVKVHFTVVPPGGKPESRDIAVGDVLSLPAEGELGIAFDSEGRPRRYLVPANSIQCFVRRDGRLDLTQLALPAREQDLQPPAAPAKVPDGPGGTVTIPVMLLVDQHEPAVRQVWEKRLRDRLKQASAVFERCCRVRFEVVAVDTWRANDANLDLAQALSDFESRVPPAPARLAIGFSSNAKLPAGPMPSAATPAPLHSHILVREGADRAGQVELLRILLHELGHFLGAVHHAEEDSVMHPALRNPRANARDFRLGFDPLNTLAMNLLADELRNRPVVRLADVRPDAKTRLRGIYKVQAEMLPNDRLAQINLVRLEHPDPPRLAPAALRPPRTERFWALFADGSQVTAAKPDGRGWWSDDAVLGGRRLFGTANPVRMLRDTTRSGSLKAAHVVLANGDVLPGRVVKFLPPSPHDGRPARLRLALDAPLVAVGLHDLEVRADRVLRLAAAPGRASGGEPGTLVSTDGGRVVATALRWTEEGVQALTKNGVVTKAFSEIADLRVPGVDVLDAVLDDGRYPPPGDRHRRGAAGDGGWGGADLSSRDDPGGRAPVAPRRPGQPFAPAAQLVASRDPGADRRDLAAEFPQARRGTAVPLAGHGPEAARRSAPLAVAPQSERGGRPPVERTHLGGLGRGNAPLLRNRLRPASRCPGVSRPGGLGPVGRPRCVRGVQDLPRPGLRRAPVPKRLAAGRRRAGFRRTAGSDWDETSGARHRVRRGKPPAGGQSFRYRRPRRLADAVGPLRGQIRRTAGGR